MEKRKNKALTGAMVFLAVYLVILLATSVYMFLHDPKTRENIREMHMDTSKPTGESLAPTNTSIPFCNRIKGLKQRALKILKYAASLSKIPDYEYYKKEMEEIKNGVGISEKIKEKMVEYEDVDISGVNSEEEKFEKNEYPTKNMRFVGVVKDGKEDVEIETNLFSHVLKFENALGIPGSYGMLFYDSNSGHIPEVKYINSFEELCNKLSLIVAKNFEKDSSKKVAYYELKKIGPLELTIVNSNNLDYDAFFISYDPEYHEYRDALIVEERKVSRNETDKVIGMHISSALGIHGARGFYFSSMKNYPDDASVFDSSLKFNNFLQEKNLIHFDEDTFSVSMSNFTVHFAAADPYLFRDLKLNIEPVVEAIINGAWAYPNDHYEFWNEPDIKFILSGIDLAILIVFDEVDDGISNMDLIINNYTFLAGNNLEKESVFLGFSFVPQLFGYVKLFQILYKGKEAYHFTFKRKINDKLQENNNLTSRFYVIKEDNIENDDIYDKRRINLMKEFIKRIKEFRNDPHFLIFHWERFIWNDMNEMNDDYLDSFDVIYILE